MIKSVVTARTNAELIAEVAKLWIKPADLVVDVTWGQGKWWKRYQPQFLIAHDRDTLDGVDFCHLPEADNSVDIVAFDPPYTSPGGRVSSTIRDMNARYGLTSTPTSPLLLDVEISIGVKEAARILNPGGRLLFKINDYVSSGKFHQGHYHAVTAAHEAGLEQVDEFIHASGTGPQPLFNLNGTLRRQVHSRRSHSFLLVFTKPRRSH